MNKTGFATTASILGQPPVQLPGFDKLKIPDTGVFTLSDLEHPDCAVQRARLLQYQEVVNRYMAQNHCSESFRAGIDNHTVQIAQIMPGTLRSWHEDQRLFFLENSLSKSKLASIQFPFKTDSLGEASLTERGDVVLAGPISLVRVSANVLVTRNNSTTLKPVLGYVILNGNHRVAKAMLSEAPDSSLFAVQYSNPESCRAVIGVQMKNKGGSWGCPSPAGLDI